MFFFSIYDIKTEAQALSAMKRLIDGVIQANNRSKGRFQATRAADSRLSALEDKCVAEAWSKPLSYLAEVEQRFADRANSEKVKSYSLR